MPTSCLEPHRRAVIQPWRCTRRGSWWSSRLLWLTACLTTLPKTIATATKEIMMVRTGICLSVICAFCVSQEAIFLTARVLLLLYLVSLSCSECIGRGSLRLRTTCPKGRGWRFRRSPCAPDRVKRMENVAWYQAKANSSVTRVMK